MDGTDGAQVYKEAITVREERTNELVVDTRLSREVKTKYSSE